MDTLFSSHKRRQCEQSTWVWTEQCTVDTQPQQGEKVDARKGEATFKGKKKRSPLQEPTARTGKDLEHEAQACRSRQTLENALVTIDVLRSKLVGVLRAFDSAFVFASFLDGNFTTMKQDAVR